MQYRARTAQIVADYRLGKSVAQIREAHGITAAYLNYVLTLTGTKKSDWNKDNPEFIAGRAEKLAQRKVVFEAQQREQRLAKERKARIIAAYERGDTLVEIARRYKIFDAAAVNVMLTNWGVARNRRSKSSAG